MINLIENEISRCITGIKFKIVFLALFFYSILGFINSTLSAFGKNSLHILTTNNMSAIMNPWNRSFVDLLIILLPIIACFLHADSYLQERENSIDTYYLVRIKQSQYILAKAIAIIVINFMTFFLIFTINEILNYIAIPNVGVANEYGLATHELYGRNEGYFMHDIYLAYPFLYNYLLITIMSIYSVCLGLMSYGISLLFMNIKRLYLCIYIFLVVNLVNIILPIEYQVSLYIQGVPGEVNNLVKAIGGWLCMGIVIIIIGSRKK